MADQSPVSSRKRNPLALASDQSRDNKAGLSWVASTVFVSSGIAAIAGLAVYVGVRVGNIKL